MILNLTQRIEKCYLYSTEIARNISEVVHHQSVDGELIEKLRLHAKFEVRAHIRCAWLRCKLLSYAQRQLVTTSCN